MPVAAGQVRALAEVLDVLAARPAEDPAGAVHTFSDVATTMAARLRTHLEQACADEERDRETGDRELPSIDPRKLIDD